MAARANRPSHKVNMRPAAATLPIWRETFDVIRMVTLLDLDHHIDI
jgi:hypothetical protein